MRFSVTSAALASALLMKVAAAQSIYPEWNPDDISEGDKTQWCTNQQEACPLLCYDRGTILAQDGNYCDPETLSYTCICDDGQSPNLDTYSQTIPYFKCRYQVEQCVENCNGIAICASRCREDKPCGAQDPPKDNSTIPTNTKTSSPTAEPTESGGFKPGFGTDGDDEDDKESSASSFGKNYGLATMIFGLGATFAFFL